MRSGKGMLQPRLADLFKTFVVSRSTAHAIKILRNDRMIGVRHRKPIQRDSSVIAGGRSDRDAHLSCVTAKLLRGGEISDDDIRSWARNSDPRSSTAPRRRQDRRLHRTVDERGGFDRIHRRRDRNPAHGHPGVRGSPKCARKLFRNQQPPLLDAERPRGRIILVEISFDVEENKTRFAVAHGQIKGCIRRKLFDDELA